MTMTLQQCPIHRCMLTSKEACSCMSGPSFLGWSALPASMLCLSSNKAMGKFGYGSSLRLPLRTHCLPHKGVKEAAHEHVCPRTASATAARWSVLAQYANKS